MSRLLGNGDRRLEELEAPFSFPENCCPGCACGPEWREIADAQERRAFVLARLLMKRARLTRSVRDFKRAENLFYDYGTGNEWWRRWRDEQTPRVAREVINGK